MSKAEMSSENSASLVRDDKGIGKLNNSREDTTERKVTGKKKKTDEKILLINRQRQRILMEANIEKDKRLEDLEKEINDHNTQHREGIYWLRMQLETSRLEKTAADERISELQKELRSLTSMQPARNISLDPTITDSVGGGDEKGVLIAQLQNRLEKFESSFGVMENQISMINSSSAKVIQTLKEEIAHAMEDRTRSELDLRNQLSKLDNENRQRQLEFTLELYNKDEIIATLRSQETCSTSGTTAETKNSISGCETWSHDQTNDLSTDLIRASKDHSSLVLRLGEANTELQRKLDKANKELKDLKSESKASDTFLSEQRVSEERRAIDLSLDGLKTVVGSTNNAVSEVRELIKTVETDDYSGGDKVKKRMLSVLDSASLIHEEVKLSILLTELKLRNEFECLNKNKLAFDWGDQANRNKQQLINDLKKIENDALVELEKAGGEFSRQINDLEKRIRSEKSKLGKKDTHKRAKNHASKWSEPCNTNALVVFHELNRLNKLVSYSQVDRDSGDGSESTGDRLMISRNVLNLLEKELLQSAERIKAKNKKIGSLKVELDRSKIRETHLRKELRDSIKQSVSSKSYKVSNDVGETSKADRKDSMFSKSIPREIHTKTEDQSTLSPVLSPGQQERKKLRITLKGESRRRRKGMSDDSQEGGTTPAKVPAHFLTTGDRIGSIGFVPSPSKVGKSNNSNATSTTKPLSDTSKRVEPTSRDVKKLVFLPPCFFNDLEQLS